jgi:hypothetical protein
LQHRSERAGELAGGAGSWRPGSSRASGFGMGEAGEMEHPFLGGPGWSWLCKISRLEVSLTGHGA